MTAILRIPKAKYMAYRPFSVDGRLKAKALPNEILPGTHPTEVTNATARRLIDELWRMGFTNHSSHGTMLWVAIAWCRENKRPFEVWKWREGGYCLHLDKINPAICTRDAEKVL